MPAVAVLVEVLSKLAVAGAVGLHHVAVLQAGGPVLLRTLLAAVRGAASHRVAAAQRRTRHLLTVNLPRGALRSERQQVGDFTSRKIRASVAEKPPHVGCF